MTISCEENLKSASGMHGILRTNIELYISIHGTVSHGVFSLEEPSERVKGHEMVGIKKTCMYCYIVVVVLSMGSFLWEELASL